jgi:curved DNA-binding protein CbpA
MLLYDVLDVPCTCSQDQIRKAYLAKALELHPDKNLHNTQEADALFSNLNEAFAVLSDPKSRRKYDSLIQEDCARRSHKADFSSRYSTTGSTTKSHGVSTGVKYADEQKTFYFSTSTMHKSADSCRCPNRLNGCSWTGNTRCLCSHLLVCGYCESWVLQIRAHLHEELHKARLQLSRVSRGHQESLSRAHHRAIWFLFLGSVVGMTLGVTLMLILFSMYGAIHLN